MVALALYFLIPVLWMIFASTKSTADLNSSFGFWFADIHFVQNLKTVFVLQDGIFLRWMGNSLLYAGVGSLGATLIAAAAGYSLAKFHFAGRDALLGFILGGVLIPATVLALPTYILLDRVGLINTYWAVFLPSLGSTFGVFLCRIYVASSVPDEIIEAARVDGAGEVRIFFTIVLRMVVPALVTVFLFSFISIWNNFFLPLIVLNDERKWPVTLGLYSLQQSAQSDPDIVRTVVTGSLVSTIPLVILFLVLQRYWRSGLTAGALK
ncbi:multiple sugar transport system permease protein [Kineococcus rhizosphaerae]|uniref:Multiple sugar transport system permease protein n=2 Tax=Kineococcus rhizosphaerae TaxID=559628 RepID=A0A2T0QR70_9ACTN|nr:multiple sugar transport system permease protein [Kineococcus rhizosphaerae]